MDKLLDWAIEIQSLAQAGLSYTENPYDIERYERLREISAEIMAQKTGEPLEKVKGLFCNESGYQTPKADTRAAVFLGEKILLVKENNGTWSLPGGWCDVNMSAADNAVKEVYEEAGLKVKCEKLIAVQDWRKHNVTNYAYGVIKLFFLCSPSGGSFLKNIETVAAEYFSRDSLPPDLANEKTTREQILMCFDAHGNPDFQTLFD